MITRDIQEFCQNMVDLGVILSIDFGTKKLGIAVSNKECTMALPLTIVQNDMSAIAALIQEYKPKSLVVGFPINMDGTLGAQAKIVQGFALRLYDQFKLPIFLEDERLTTRAANEALMALGLSRKKCEERDDKVAASMILETTLESLTRLRRSLK